MARDKVLTKDQVLEVLRARDNREYPAMTVTDLAEYFPDRSSKTVRRRLTELVEDGDVNKRELTIAAIYWSASPASCPQCGADLTDTEVPLEYGCKQCDSLFNQIRDPDGPTDEAIARDYATGVAVWWASLPSKVKRGVTWVASFAFDTEDVTEYRPDQISYDNATGEIYIDWDEGQEDPYADSASEGDGVPTTQES